MTAENQVATDQQNLAAAENTLAQHPGLPVDQLDLTGSRLRRIVGRHRHRRRHRERDGHRRRYRFRFGARDRIRERYRQGRFQRIRCLGKQEQVLRLRRANVWRANVRGLEPIGENAGSRVATRTRPGPFPTAGPAWRSTAPSSWPATRPPSIRPGRTGQGAAVPGRRRAHQPHGRHRGVGHPRGRAVSQRRFDV